MAARMSLHLEMDAASNILWSILLHLFFLRWNVSTTTPQINSAEYCEGDFLMEQRIQSKITTVVLAIFFVSLLGVGMGQTAVYTLGIPYIDDNVASRESPLYFGESFSSIAKIATFSCTHLFILVFFFIRKITSKVISANHLTGSIWVIKIFTPIDKLKSLFVCATAITIGVRILGPALGFILGSLCTMVYADLSRNPQITPTDPRWVGAWWLGKFTSVSNAVRKLDR